MKFFHTSYDHLHSLLKEIFDNVTIKKENVNHNLRKGYQTLIFAKDIKNQLFAIKHVTVKSSNRTQYLQ